MIEQSAPRQSEFDRCAPYIEAALKYGPGMYTIEDIRAGIVASEMQLWPGKKSCMVTTIANSPQKTFLEILIVGGDMAELTEMEKSVSAYAKALGVDGVAAAGRAGWRRVLERLGYEFSSVTMIKEV